MYNEGVERLKESKMIDDSNEIVSPRHNRTDELAETGRCTRPTQTESQDWEGKMDIGSHPSQHAICNWKSLAKENSFLSWSVTGYINIHEGRKAADTEIVANTKWSPWWVFFVNFSFCFGTFLVLSVFCLFDLIFFSFVVLLWLFWKKEHNEVGWIGRCVLLWRAERGKQSDQNTLYEKIIKTLYFRVSIYLLASVY